MVYGQDSLLPTCPVSWFHPPSPYWSVRDYKLTPQTWDGDPNCTHTWDDDKKRLQGTHCIYCNAWLGNLGMEPTVEMYLEHMVAMFREVWRVLRDDGTLWLNMGDTYGGSGQGWMKDGSNKAGKKQNSNKGSVTWDRPPDTIYERPPNYISSTQEGGLKPKDLVGMPWRVALALQADGWYLRSDVIWAKDNPMPESVLDRPTASHEYVFLMAKSGRTLFWVHSDGPGVRLKKPPPDYYWINDETGEEQDTAPPGWAHRRSCNGCGECVSCLWGRVNRWSGRDYFYDAEAIKEPASPNTHARIANATENDGQGEWKSEGHEDEFLGRKGRERKPGTIIKDMAKKVGINPKAAENHPNSKQNASFAEATSQQVPLTANKRSVWLIPTQPNKLAHFATFPENLVEPCILAGTSGYGVCAECGAPYCRIVGSRYLMNRPSAGDDPRSRAEDRQAEGYPDGHQGWRGNNILKETTTVGWQPPVSTYPSPYLPQSLTLSPALAPRG